MAFLQKNQPEQPENLRIIGRNDKENLIGTVLRKIPDGEYLANARPGDVIDVCYVTKEKNIVWQIEVTERNVKIIKMAGFEMKGFPGVSIPTVEGKAYDRLKAMAIGYTTHMSNTRQEDISKALEGLSKEILPDA